MTNGGGSMMSYKQAIKRNEKRIRESYTALGIRAYNLIKQGTVSSAELEAVVADIDAVAAENAYYEQAISGLQAARAAARGTRCPYCGTTAAPGTRFCPGCGQDLAYPAAQAAANTVMCPSCRGMTDADSKFCVLCGAQLVVAAPAQPVQPEAQPAQAEAQPVQPETQEPVAEAAAAADRCPACGDELEENADFCGSCGNKLLAEAGNKCPHCGDLLEDDAVFCVSCGQKV